MVLMCGSHTNTTPHHINRTGQDRTGQCGSMTERENLRGGREGGGVGLGRADSGPHVGLLLGQKPWGPLRFGEVLAES